MDKYYLYVVNNKKSILLSSSNSKSKLREKALEKIADRIDKYDGLYLYRVKLMKVSKKEIAKETNSKIKVIGGPLVAIIEKILINVGKNKTKLKSIDDKTNRIYFSEKYLKKNDKKVSVETINNMIWKWVHNKFNTGLFAVNVINE
jgi:hypothetical protein